MRLRSLRVASAMLAIGLIAASCGGDDDDSSSSPATDVTDGTGADSGEEPAAGDDPADLNGDGKVVIGFASAGDTNDGGFYQSQMSGARTFVEEMGWEFILVDRVRPNDAVAELSNLARQNPDMIISGGGSELIDATRQVSEEFADIAWALLGGSDEPTEFYSNATQDYNEVHYLAGVAMALVLERSGGDTIGFVAGPELDFTVTASNALEVGLQTRIPDGTVLATYTGDFNDAGLAVEAAKAQINQGVDIIYGFLGGAARAVIEEAQNSDVPVAVQPGDQCAAGGFAVSVVFSQGAYAVGILEAFRDGIFEEGSQRVFRIGKDPDQVNAIICDASADEQEILDQVAADIASGKIDPAKEVSGS